MTKDLFPASMKTETKNKLSGLAETVYQTDIKNLTREKVMILVQMDMATTINKINVGASATRPTNIKYATNNYHASMEIDLSGIGKLIVAELDKLTEEELVDKYLELKSTLYSFIRTKYESSETYLRTLLDTAIKKDGCPPVARGDDS